MINEKVKLIYNKSKKYMPNVITTARLGMAMVLPILFFTGNKLLTLVTFAVAAASDAADGYLARKWKVVSKYGKIIDPIADKLLSGGAMILSALFINNLMVLPLILETMIAAVNVVRYLNKDDVNTTMVGKIKTGALFSTLLLCLTSPLIPVINNIMPALVAVTSAFQILTIKSYKDQFKQNNIKQTKFDADINDITYKEEKETTKEKVFEETKVVKNQYSYEKNDLPVENIDDEKGYQKIKKF